MNRKLDEFINNIKDKKIAVLGLGISNRPLISFLYSSGARNITGFDKACGEYSEQIVDTFENEGIKIKYSFGENYLEKLEEGFDYIFKTPVVRFDIPELLEAKKKGSIITSEMEIFMELCPAKIIAVTGSDGKTTTTTLIYKMITEAGYKTWLGGNIGAPLINELNDINQNDIVVLELSSFQLHTMSVSPHIAVVTNISPNHLDVHKSYAEYIEAKENIFSHQNAAKGDFVVLNKENNVTSEDYQKKAPAGYRMFSSKTYVDKGAYVYENHIYYNDGNTVINIMSCDDIMLPGKHNLENYLAAITAAYDYVTPEIIINVARHFAGVEHRLELVRILDGVKYYNSSIDSSPSRTIAALSTFKEKIILIAGGKDKGIPYDNLGPHLYSKVKVLVLVGATSDKIEKSLDDEVAKRGTINPVRVIRCCNYKEAVEAARGNAKEGDCILLSPASTSFDMFRNFEERGNTFKRIVKDLI